MTNVNITGKGADLVQSGLADFLKLNTVTATSTELVATASFRLFHQKFTITNKFEGKDFTYNSADRFTGGKVTDWSFDATEDGRPIASLTISDFAISAVKLVKLMKEDSPRALLSEIFSGDDIFTTARTKSTSEVNINGYGGDDSIGGSAGNDKLAGGADDDVLAGGAGKDALRGGTGTDTLRGNVGGDQFIFDAALGPDNIDHILDFATGSDTIVLENRVFNELAAGNLDSDAFFIGIRATDSDDRVVYNSTSGKLYFDLDGKGGGKQVFFAQLEAELNLLDTDFRVI